MHSKYTNDHTQTFDVVVTRIFDAPVEEVWKAWSDPSYVTRWWGPTGFTSPSAEMDFRVGGASLVCMRAPAEYGGQDTYHTWTYTGIDPHERIEFVSNFADKDGTHLDPAAMGMPTGIQRDVPHAIGSLEKPMSDRDLEAKFRDLAAGTGCDAGTLTDLVWSLEALDDAAQLARAAVTKP